MNPTENEEFQLRSEFAWVRVTRSDSQCGPQLLVEDLVGGRSIYLDPLELETLAWSSHRDLDYLLDPSRSRWAAGDSEWLSD
jgi:hypothetical protein